MPTTSFMSLNLPTVSVTVGPEWASQLNTALTAIDAHDHSVGKGPKITPLGLNINADLSMGSNNLGSTKSVRFSNQAATLGDAADVRSVYVYDNDLYYNNESGTAIQLTNGNAAYGPSIGSFTANRAIVSNGSGLLAVASTTATEIGYVNGVTSAIQTQLNTKVTDPMTTNGDIIVRSSGSPARLGIGAADTVLKSDGTAPFYGQIVNADIDNAAAIAYSKLDLSDSLTDSDINSAAAIAYSKLNLADSIVNADINSSAAIDLGKLATVTASRALVSNGSGFVSAHGSTTATEIGHLSGVTSAIQTQIDGKVDKSTLTAKGDLFIATASGTIARLEVGADGTFLKADSGTTEGASWASPSVPSFTYQAESTTYTAAVGEIIDASGAPWTLTLPTAVGQSGKSIKVKHSGTSLTQVYTIDTTSGQTVGGLASGVVKLYTNGEVFEFTSDGANWLIAQHFANTNPVSYTPTFTGLGTPSNVEGVWWREGKFLNAIVRVTAGTVTAAAVTATLPGSMSIDTTALPAAFSYSVGLLWDQGTTTAVTTPITTRGPHAVVVDASSLTTVRFVADVDTDATGTSNLYWKNNVATEFWTSNTQGYATFRVPIAGWQP